MFDDPNAAYIVISFIVPGFVLHSTLCVFQARRTLTSELYILRFLTLSAINYAAWSWIIYVIAFESDIGAHPFWSALGWFWVIFVGPVLLGIAWALATQREWPRWALSRLGLRPIHVTPSAWDWRFGTMVQPHWILLTMKDGSSVAGWFGSASFASSDPVERDLYIEQIFEIDHDGTWRMGPKDKGILVAGSQMKHAEIWAVEEEST